MCITCVYLKFDINIGKYGGLVKIKKIHPCSFIKSDHYVILKRSFSIDTEGYYVNVDIQSMSIVLNWNNYY